MVGRGRGVAGAGSGGRTGRHQGPRALELGGAGQVQQQLLLMVAADDLQPDRKPVDGAGRDGHGRVAGEVGRDGQHAVVGQGPLEAVLGHQVHVPHGGGHGALGREGHVGIGGAEDEVHLLEQVGHALVAVDAEHLGGPGHLGGEVVGSHVEGELDLRGQVVVAGREAVTQLADQPDGVGHHPLEPALGQVDHHVDPGEAGAGHQGFGRLHQQRGGPGLHDGRVEVDGDHGPLAGQLEGAEVGLPPAHPGKAEGVAGVGAVAHVEPPGRVAHRTGEAAVHDGEGRLEHGRSPGDAAVGGLQPDQSGESGRDPDGAAAVAAAGDGEEPAGDGGGRASRRAPRRAGRIPRAAGGSVQLGAGVVHRPELGGGGLGRQHRPGGPQPRHQGGVTSATRSAKTRDASV